MFEDCLIIIYSTQLLNSKCVVFCFQAIHLKPQNSAASARNEFWPCLLEKACAKLVKAGCFL